MKKYSVYEKYDTHSNYIGSIKATNKQKAIKKAHNRFGAPIEVKEK